MAKSIPILKARQKYKERLIFTLGIRRKPFRLFCEHCGKFIPSDMQWKCGVCDYENLQTYLNSFLNKCKNCKTPPKSFLCPHCNGMMFLV